MKNKKERMAELNALIPDEGELEKIKKRGVPLEEVLKKSLTDLDLFFCKSPKKLAKREKLEWFKQEKGGYMDIQRRAMISHENPLYSKNEVYLDTQYPVSYLLQLFKILYDNGIEKVSISTKDKFPMLINCPVLNPHEKEFILYVAPLLENEFEDEAWERYQEEESFK